MNPIEPPAHDFKAVTRRTLTDSVYTQLKAAIVHGRLRDGAELKQAELATELGVSRVPVREALRQLQAEHLVVATPFQRYVVTSLNREQIRELLELREELEVFALRRTLASSEREERLAAAKAAAERLDVDMEEDDWLAADRAFHRALNGENTAVSALIEDVRERVHRYLFTAGGGSRRRYEVVEEHAAVLRSLESGDASDLEASIRAHVGNTRQFLEHSTVSAGPSEAAAPGELAAALRPE
jgi:DNA-binding GntR family transcriptional regulator